MNKEKIQGLINQQRTNLADVEYLDLDSIANVIESFENPSVEDENLQLGVNKDISELQPDKDLLDIRYSLSDKPRRRPGESLISYNRRLELWKNELDETVITNDYKQNKNAIEYGKMLKDEYINSEIYYFM